MNLQSQDCPSSRKDVNSTLCCCYCGQPITKPVECIARIAGKKANHPENRRSFTPEHTLRISLAMKGNVPWNKGRKNRPTLFCCACNKLTRYPNSFQEFGYAFSSLLCRNSAVFTLSPQTAETRLRSISLKSRYVLNY